LKYKLAGVFEQSTMFPGQMSMWEMTAAQRSLLVTPDKGGKSPAMPAPLSMDRLEEMTAKTLQKIADRNAKSLG